MLPLCMIPLILVGYTTTLDWSKTPPPNENGPILEVQSCERGLGGHVKVTSRGLYAVGFQYGLGTELGPVSVTLQPRMGFSATDHTNRNLPQGVQFEVGLQFLIGIEQYRLALDYWHLSNAGITDPNIGMDLLGVLVGYAF
jgi:hypothetical protein